jgi:ubiquinone/menaquinone biosynthesis C-methylase UbiE
MRRVVTPELLDSDSGTPAELERSLRDLRRINRWFGGIRTTRRMLEKVTARADGGELTLLDVGAGSGDVSLASARALRPRTRVRVILLDRIAAHMPRNGTPRVAADALTLPFRDASFDLVTCSLLLHHLERDQIVRFVDEALRVARVAVLLNDLRREPLHLAAVYAGFPLFGRLSRHDGVASVRRSYTPGEIRSVLSRTRAASVELENSYLFRMGIVAWKRACP